MHRSFTTLAQETPALVCYLRVPVTVLKGKRFLCTVPGKVPLCTTVARRFGTFDAVICWPTYACLNIRNHALQDSHDKQLAHSLDSIAYHNIVGLLRVEGGHASPRHTATNNPIRRNTHLEAGAATHGLTYMR